MSYRLSLPHVSLHLKEALGRMQCGPDKNLGVGNGKGDQQLQGRMLINLHDAIWGCHRNDVHTGTQTDANICTEAQCKALVADVLQGAKEQVQYLLERTKFLVQQRDGIIEQLDSKLRSLISSPAAGHGASLGDVSRNQTTIVPLQRNLSDPEEDLSQTTTWSPQTLAQLKEAHKVRRMALKQRRREERSMSLANVADDGSQVSASCDEQPNG